MKYMLMMFGSAGEMIETVSPEWIAEMITFMRAIDPELAEAGELVFQAGLADGATAKTVRLANGSTVATDGPIAAARESLIGFWVVDVASEARAIEIAGRIAKYAQQVEVRRVMDAPPEF